MTVTPRAVRRYTRTERLVYQTAVRLAEVSPTGFDADMLAAQLGCTPQDAERWLKWLKATGDFDPADEPARH